MARFCNRKSLACLAMVMALALAGCGKSEQEHFDKANSYLSSGDIQAAAIEFKNVLQSNPDNAQARKSLGEVYLQLGDGAAAEKELRRARDLGVTDVNLALAKALLLLNQYQQVLDVLMQATTVAGNEVERQVLLGDAYLGLRQPPQAEQAFQAALSKQSDYAPALLGLGKLALIQRDTEAARRYVDQALAKDVGYIDAWLVKGDMAFQESHYDDAVHALEQALHGAQSTKAVVKELQIRSRMASVLLAQNKPTEASAQIDVLLKKAPNNPLAQYLKARAAFQQNDMAVASDYVQRVLKRVPDHRPSQLLLGAINLREGHLEQAEMYLSSFVAAVPSHIPARKLLAATRVKLQHPEGAMEALTPVLDQGQDDVQLLAMIGQAALTGGDSKTGINYMEKAVAASPDQPALRDQLAAAYMSAGQTDKAITELESIAKQGVDHYQAQSLLVLGYLRKKDNQKALAKARELVANFPKEPHAYAVLGTTYRVTGNSGSAREEFEKALALKPGFVPALTSLAEMDYQDGNLTEARSHFEQALQQDAKNIAVLMALSHIAERLGDDKQALSWLEQARSADSNAIAPRLRLAQFRFSHGALNEAKTLLDEAAHIRPDSTAVLAMQGQLELGQGNASKALGIFRQLTQRDPNSAQAYYFMAVAQQAMNDTDGVRRSLEKALELKPDMSAALMALTQLEIKTGQSSKAKTLIAKVQHDSPNSGMASALQGDLLMAQGDYRHAADAYAAAFQAKAVSTLLLKEYGALTKAGDAAGAFKLLEAHLAKYPDDAQVRFALAEGYQGAGSNRNAITHYEKILESHKDSASVLNNLAWLYMQEGDQRALDYAQRAYELVPQNGGIADTLGWLQVKAGQVEQGLKVLRKAASLEPRVPEIRYHLAIALAKNGQKEDAQKELSVLLNSGRAFEGRDDAQVMMKELQ